MLMFTEKEVYESLAKVNKRKVNVNAGCQLVLLVLNSLKTAAQVEHSLCFVMDTSSKLKFIN